MPTHSNEYVINFENVLGFNSTLPPRPTLDVILLELALKEVKNNFIPKDEIFAEVDYEQQRYKIKLDRPLIKRLPKDLTVDLEKTWSDGSNSEDKRARWHDLGPSLLEKGAAGDVYPTSLTIKFDSKGNLEAAKPSIGKVIKLLRSKGNSPNNEIKKSRKEAQIGREAGISKTHLVSLGSANPNYQHALIIPKGRGYDFFSAFWADSAQNQSLKELQKKVKGLSIGQRLVAVYSLLDAYKALHEKNLVHGDVKPENIMIDVNEYGVVFIKIIDFSGAAYIGDLRCENAVPHVGTTIYAVPQMLDRDRDGELNHKATPTDDSYGIAVLIAMLMGAQDPMVNRYYPDWDKTFIEFLGNKKFSAARELLENTSEINLKGMLLPEPSDRAKLITRIINELTLSDVRITAAYAQRIISLLIVELDSDPACTALIKTFGAKIEEIDSFILYNHSELNHIAQELRNLSAKIVRQQQHVSFAPVMLSTYVSILNEANPLLQRADQCIAELKAIEKYSKLYDRVYMFNKLIDEQLTAFQSLMDEIEQEFIKRGLDQGNEFKMLSEWHSAKVLCFEQLKIEKDVLLSSDFFSKKTQELKNFYNDSVGEIKKQLIPIADKFSFVRKCIELLYALFGKDVVSFGVGKYKQSCRLFHEKIITAVRSNMVAQTRVAIC